MTITRSTIAGHDAFTISGRRLATTCVPGRGSHLTSLMGDGHEWLSVPAGGPQLAPVSADSCFMPHQEGADDCFPTIKPGIVRGVHYPDHGAVWHQPWRICEAVDRLRLRIAVPNCGLACERVIEPEGDGLRLSWTISNHARHPVPYLWCWHPLFAWRPGDRLELPGVTQVMHWRRGILSALDWPLAHPGMDLSAGLIGAEEGVKCFVPATGHAILHSAGAALSIRWDPLVLPWMGLWIRHEDDQHQWAVEPASVPRDGVARMNAIPPEAMLPAEDERAWTIRLQPA